MERGALQLHRSYRNDSDYSRDSYPQSSANWVSSTGMCDPMDSLVILSAAFSLCNSVDRSNSQDSLLCSSLSPLPHGEQSGSKSEKVLEGAVAGRRGDQGKVLQPTTMEQPWRAASTSENTTTNSVIGQSLCPRRSVVLTKGFHPPSLTGIHAFALCWSSSENYYTVEFHGKNLKTEILKIQFLFPRIL